MANTNIVAHAFEIYPESNDIDKVIALTNAMHIPCSYILHDKDTKPDGSLKKFHYHVMSAFKLTSKQKHVLSDAFGIAHFEDIRCAEEYYAYLTHSRDKDIESGKHRYDDTERKCNDVSFDWSDISNYVPLKSSYVMLQEIYNIIRDNDICFFYDLVSWCIDNGHNDYFEVIHKPGNVYALTRFMEHRVYVRRSDNESIE